MTDETKQEPGESEAPDLLSAIARRKAEFLAGDMEPALERHCLNVGRVAVEFACLEEDIGHLVVADVPGARRTPDAYMDKVMHSRKIHGLLRTAAATVGPNSYVDLGALQGDYQRFKSERDRYAHSSVGSSTSFDETTRVLSLDTMKQKHPKGADHPRGRVSDLPTDAETDELCREMRAYRYGLQQAASSIVFENVIATLKRGIDLELSATAKKVKNLVDNAGRAAVEQVRTMLTGRGPGPGSE